MADARSIASLSLSFGLVSIPVRVYTATESGSDVSFKLLAPDGSRIKQQYVSQATGKVVERAEMIKGYEIQKDGDVVTFTRDELKALEESPIHIVEILGFVPDQSVDPVYYDEKTYFVTPDKHGAKPYCLLEQALIATKRCAIARWNWKGKTHIVLLRAHDDGIVLHQLRWGDEVRSIHDLKIEQVSVSPAELDLAIKIIEQGAIETYDPSQYEDEEKKRVLAAIDAKIEGKQIIKPAEEPEATSGQVIDLMDALRASLTGGAKAKAPEAAPATEATTPADDAAMPAKRRRIVKRAEAAPEAAAPAKRARR